PERDGGVGDIEHPGKPETAEIEKITDGAETNAVDDVAQRATPAEAKRCAGETAIRRTQPPEKHAGNHERQQNQRPAHDVGVGAHEPETHAALPHHAQIKERVKFNECEIVAK